ncbi:hypothetical protein L227DRAFT_195892 [Lentinus tigrinus ALCF2SS1-6]|uniref:Uncharacterized protein n=1 Tax=Lentinus tigrinus ALCF2SS1-6 TaxID=1328759 RepID=A0A5C2S518_9APHY|nr:hypothetical protein L227DRAFT_195892 [Lentinus tigrinus ALCF2SS1-6]
MRCHCSRMCGPVRILQSARLSSEPSPRSHCTTHLADTPRRDILAWLGIMSSCIEAELLFFVRFWSLHTSKLVSNVAIIHHPCVMKTLLWLGCFGSSHHGPRPFVTNRRHAVNTNRGLRGDYRRSLRRAIPLPALQLCARLGYGVRARMVLFDSSDYVLHVNTNVVQLYATGDHLHTRRRRSKRLVVAAHPSHPRKRCRSCNAGPWDPSRCCSPRRLPG